VTKVLAAELGPRGIRVNAVRPGGVFTELNQRAGWLDAESARARLEAMAPAHALGRIGTPEEVAEGVKYLLLADWVTGTVLTVDGGLSLGVTNA
jgi:NAD(P)-dependent dehydrogenase (short-subunit alcohol dehydrogenase family)